MKKTRPQRRALPNLYLDIETYKSIAKLAKSLGFSIAELCLEAIEGYADEPREGCICILMHVKTRTFEQYLEWFEGDEDLVFSSIAGHVEAGGQDFENYLKKYPNGYVCNTKQQRSKQDEKA